MDIKTKLALLMFFLTAIFISGCVGPPESYITYETNVTEKDAVGREIQALPHAYSGEPYTWQITPSGGAAPYNCTLAQGSSLPGTLQFQGCTISGNAPWVSVDTFFAFQFFITDANDTIAGPFELSLPIRLRPPYLGLPRTLDGAVIGQDYEYIICTPRSQRELDCGGAPSSTNPSLGAPPYTFYASGLPVGLKMELNGEIRGRIHEGYETLVRKGLIEEKEIEICVVDSRRFQTCGKTMLPIISAVQPLTLVLRPPQTCTASILCTVQLVAQAEGGRPRYYFRLEGNAPEGMILDEEGVLAGVPEKTGVYNFGVCIRDADAATSCKRTSLIVVAPAKPTISLDTDELVFSTSEGTNPPPQSFSIKNTGSSSSYLNYTITDETGGRVTISPRTGTLAYLESSTISVSIDTRGLRAAGYKGTITVSDPDATNSPQTVTVRLIIYLPTTPTPTPTARMPTLIVQEPDNLPSGTLGRYYEYAFSVSGGTPPYSIDGIVGLPFGLKEEGITIKGTINPDYNAPGNYRLQLCVRDAAGERYCISTNLPIRAP